MPKTLISTLFDSHLSFSIMNVGNLIFLTLKLLDLLSGVFYSCHVYLLVQLRDKRFKLLYVLFSERYMI